MKNIALKAAFALPLLAVGTVGAQAQVATTPDPTLTLAYNNDTLGTLGPRPTIGAVSLVGEGVGYSATGTQAQTTNNKLANSTTAATSQAIYDPFVFDSTVDSFNGLAAGQTVQFGLHAFGYNQPNTDPTVPVTVDLSLYAYSPTLSAAGLPITGSNLLGSPVAINVNNAMNTADSIFFSNDVTLASAISANTQYVLEVSGTPDYATVDFLSNAYANNAANVNPASRKLEETLYATNGAGTQTLPQTTGPLGIRIYASSVTIASPAVPESGSFALFALGTLPLGLLIAQRRRTA